MGAALYMVYAMYIWINLLLEKHNFNLGLVRSSCYVPNTLSYIYQDRRIRL